MNLPPDQDAFAAPAPQRGRAAQLAELIEVIAQGAAARERDRALPHDEVARLAHIGFGSLRIDLADGGWGLSFRETYRLVIQLGAADSNIAHIFRNHYTISEQYTRRPYNTQSRRWQRAVVDGALIGLGNTERGSTPVGGGLPATALREDGGGYRLDGTKYYTTGTLYSDYVLVRAAFGDQVAAVIVPTDREGIEVVDDWDGIGQRLTASGTAHFRNVRAERDEVIFDSEGIGYGLAYSNTQAQLFLTAVNAGIARAALNDARDVLRGRTRTVYYATTERASEDALLQQVIGRLSANAFAAEAAVLAAANILDEISLARDEGSDVAELAQRAAVAAAQAKLIVDELAIQNGSLLFDVGGASAAARSKNLDRHWRNARTLSSHNPNPHKAAAIGAYEVSGTPLPSKGFF